MVFIQPSEPSPGPKYFHMSRRSRRSYGDRRDRNRNRWHRTRAYISASFNLMAQIVYDRDERVDIYVYKGNQAQSKPETKGRSFRAYANSHSILQMNPP